MWSESSKNQITVSSADTKKDPLISASASIALNLVTQIVNNDQIYDIKITKRKTNGDLLSKKKTLEEYGDFIDTLVAFLENYV